MTSGQPGARPLDGIRVLDFTGAWAGPMATRSLAFLGAEVIKIEGPSRMDSWRETVAGVEKSRYPDLIRGERPYNRSFRFNSQNHDKLALSLDLKSPAGVQIALDLARVCDVVVDNFSPGVMESLGLGYQALCEVRPDLIMVQMPAYGSSGPDAYAVAFGPNMEAMTGMASLMGYGGEDETPVLTSNAYLDPIGGLHGAAAVLTALMYRSRTGRGQHVEVPQRETAMQFAGELLLEQVETGEVFVPRGNAVPYAAPHDAFPALGEDEWIAIAVLDDQQWLVLCETLGCGPLAADPDFATADGRRHNAVRLHQELSSGTIQQDKWALAEQLQSRGVPAAPVCTGKDVAENPHLVSRGVFVEVDHAEAGRRRYPALGYRLESTPGRIDRASPLYGEHNHRVLSDLLGMSDQQIDQLEASGVIASAPRTGPSATIPKEKVL